MTKRNDINEVILVGINFNDSFLEMTGSTWMSAQIRHQVLIVAIAHVDEIGSRVKCASSSLKMANWQPNFESVIFIVVKTGLHCRYL